MSTVTPHSPVRDFSLSFIVRASDHWDLRLITDLATAQGLHFWRDGEVQWLTASTAKVTLRTTDNLSALAAFAAELSDYTVTS